MRWFLGTLLLGAALAAPPSASALPAAPQERAPTPLLVALHEVGQTADGKPVTVLAEDAADVVRDLERGLAGELLEVYAWVQHRLAAERSQPAEPAYLLLSERQGGFGRVGFMLGEQDKRHAGYVDVHRGWPITGRFGSVDQIFPHELAHVLRRQLVGEILEGNTNQLHALGVRTDRVVAFNEGFAEHLQAVAIDHPDAPPDTAALAADTASVVRVSGYLERYRRELTARLAFAPPMRVGFVAWFANGEDVLRYSSVRSNEYAREPVIPDRLLRDDPYEAYLLASVFPGAPDGPPRSVGRMISTEAVVASLFYTWSQDAELRSRYRDDEFYARFGTTAAEVSPLQNVYLKLFHSFLEHRPWDTLQAIAGYRRSFPDEAPAVDRIVDAIFLGQAAEAPAEIWLLNDRFRTGTTLFDQYRGLPRAHTFDLNAASLVDLVAIPGVDLPQARRIAAAAPYGSVDDVGAVAGVDASVVPALREMAVAMQGLLASAEDEEELTLSITALLMPSIRRAVLALLAAIVLGTIAYSRVRARAGARKPGWVRLLLNGAAAGSISCAAGWLAGPLPALGVAAIVFGLPAAALELRARREPSRAAGVLLAWLAAGVAGMVLTTPW